MLGAMATAKAKPHDLYIVRTALLVQQRSEHFRGRADSMAKVKEHPRDVAIIRTASMDQQRSEQ